MMTDGLEREVTSPVSLVDDGTITSAPGWPIPVTPLGEFLKGAYTLGIAEFEPLIDQAIVLLDQLYVHLPQKRNSRGIDPVQRLRLLRFHLPTLTQRQFHDEMLAIFADLHDAHTTFSLPAPFAGQSAMLPFLVEECYEDKQRTYLITSIVSGFESPTFQPGVTVTHWNGILIDRAIEIVGRSQLGSNPEALRACAIHQLTVRPMSRIAPPDELTVRLRYLGESGEAHEREFDWMVGTRPPALTQQKVLPVGGSVTADLLGIDFETEAIRRIRKALFAPEAVEIEREAALSPAEPSEDGALAKPFDTLSKLPDSFSFRDLVVDGRPVGYVRIWTFLIPNPIDFINEAIQILGLLSPDGLIIDVRDNGGGAVLAAEGLLQLLTPGPIEPERYQFANSPLTKRLAHFNTGARRWAQSIDESFQTGAVYSAGFPLTPVALANQVGQQYQGPVVVITNALCYSATDLFAAGFQDHKIGEILGVHHRTGAGGANVWEYNEIFQNLAGNCTGISTVPGGASFRVAIRRNMRVYERADLLVEEFGAEADEDLFMTRNDILNKDEPNGDLIRHAANMLRGHTVRWLRATLDPPKDGKVTVKAVSNNVSRIDAYVDGRPAGSAPVTANPTELTVSLPPSGRSVVHLKGFDKDVLVVATSVVRP
jgi:hypothetical protein